MPYYPQPPQRGFVGRPHPGHVGSGHVGSAVPAACWNVPGFKAAHDALFADAQGLARDINSGLLVAGDFGCTDDMDQSMCEAHIFALMRQDLIQRSGCAYAIPVAGQPCTSDQNIRAVQSKLAEAGLYNDTIDGNWGPNSAKALKASGLSYQQIAIGCEPPIPTYGGGGGGGTTTTPPPTGTGPGTGTGTGTGTNVGYGNGKKDSGTSPWLWAGLAAVAVVGVAVVVTSGDDT
jgi:hypothetical protein